MNLETTISPPVLSALLKRMLEYRTAQPTVPHGDFDQHRKWEQRHAKEALSELLLILSRGITPAIDCQVLDTVDRLKLKALKTPSSRYMKVALTFEDHGQACLEWDVSNGTVVACRPHPGFEGCELTTDTAELRPGDKVQVTKPGGFTVEVPQPLIAITPALVQ